MLWIFKAINSKEVDNDFLTEMYLDNHLKLETNNGLSRWFHKSKTPNTNSAPQMQTPLYWPEGLENLLRTISDDWNVHGRIFDA
jgi:hypothetical protein